MFSFKVKQLWVNNNIFSKSTAIIFFLFFSYVQEKYFVLVRIQIKKQIFFFETEMSMQNCVLDVRKSICREIFAAADIKKLFVRLSIHHGCINQRKDSTEILLASLSQQNYPWAKIFKSVVFNEGSSYLPI